MSKDGATPDATKWQHVSEPATPVETAGPRACAACGYQMGQAICTHCGEPTETDGQRIAREWGQPAHQLASLARRIDEDRSALAFANRALHDTLSAIKEALGYAGPADGDALIAHAAALRQKRDALVEEVALDDKLLAERGRLLDALPCPRHGRECVPGAIERVEELKRAEVRLKDADRIADEVAVLVVNRVIDSCSAAADALVDWRNPPRTPRSDRLAESEAERAALHARVLALEAERDTLRRKYHEAMDIMSQWPNIDVTTAVAQRNALRAALLATRDHDEPDGPCWCPAGLSSEAGCRHTPRCLHARAALGVGQATEPTP